MVHKRDIVHKESCLIGMAENKSIEVTLVSSGGISGKERKEYGGDSRGLK